MDEKKKRKRRKRSMISNIILVISLAVFLFSGYQLYRIFSEYKAGEDEYEQVKEEVITIENVKREENETEIEEEPVFIVDFEKLQSINKDAVAWIRFDEPSIINYPVVQGADNDKYLKTTIEGNRNAAGTLFVDMNNAGDFSDRNTFIYGHNMKNGSMFGRLRKYRDEAFCKENPYFYIYTPDGKEVTYQVFAVGIVESTAETYSIFFADDREFAEYIDHIQSISRYKTDVEVTAQSQIVSLSTCTNVTETQRLVVHGVKISEKMVGE